MISDATVEPLPIFVYGTLLAGQPNAFVWQGNYDLVETAVCQGACLLDSGMFPIMIDEPGHSVVGQLYHIKLRQFPAIIYALDVMEGFDPLSPHVSTFRREQREVLANSGEAVTAWTYVGSEEALRQKLLVIPDGDWLQYVASRSK